MCTWEEGRVAPIAIESSKDFVDRFIVVDKGSEDGTARIIREIAEKWGLNIEIYVRPDLFLDQAISFALKKVDEDWFLMQDGDEILHTDGPNSIFSLGRLLKRFKNVIFCAPMTLLVYDFLHTLPKVYQPKHRFLYYNNGCFIKREEGKSDLPQMFGVELHLRRVYKFNCNVKSDKRLFLRSFWREWYQNTDLREKYTNLEDYVKTKLGAQDLTPLINEWTKKYYANTIPYQENLHGYLPEVIRKYVKRGQIRGYV